MPPCDPSPPGTLPGRAGPPRRQLLAGLAAWVAGSRSARAGPGEIVLGQTIGLTGPEAAICGEMVAGLRAGFDQANALGGIHGRRLRLLTLDDHFDPELAGRNARTLIDKEKVLALVTTAGTQPVARVARECTGTPFLFPSSGTASIRKPEQLHVYYARATYAQEVRHIVRHSASLGVRRLALLYSADPFGAAGKLAFDEAMAAHRLVPAAEAATPGFASRDVGDAVSRVVAASPEAVLVYLPVAFPDAVLALRRAGVGASIYGISVALTPNALQRLGPEASRGLAFTQVFPPPNATRHPLVREYRQRMKEAGHAPSFGSMEGYVCARLAIEALQRTGSRLDGAALEEALTRKAFDLGGFRVSYQDRQRSGSSFVDIGVLDSHQELRN